MKKEHFTFFQSSASAELYAGILSDGMKRAKRGKGCGHMAITPLEQFGTIGRTQDYSIIKHQEDTKVSAEQTNIQQQVEKKADERLNQVRSADDTQLNEKKFDAKEKGSNEYTGDGGRGRKKTADQHKDGKVILKSTQSFDMKI